MKYVKTILNCGRIDIIGFIDTGSNVNAITAEITLKLNIFVTKEIDVKWVWSYDVY